jgi:hypothetical protein
MKRISLALAAVLLLNLAAWADNAFRADHPDEYVVQKGDTLWDISNRFLQTPWLWPEIWHVNPQVENPHLIFPGDVIRLVYVDGQPRLTVERTVKMAPGTTKLSPTIRVLSEDEAIPTIPLDRIDSFLSRRYSNRSRPRLKICTSAPRYSQYRENSAPEHPAPITATESPDVIAERGEQSTA